MANIQRILILAAFALVPCTAAADPVNYSFEVTATTGPLSGTSASGAFSFDSSIIPGGGGALLQVGLLTDLAFTWNGIAYTEATANTGYLVFNAAGALTNFCFGNNAAAGSCTVMFGQEQWYAAGGDFRYSTPGIVEGYLGTITFQLVANGVPEPGTLALLGLGLGGLALSRRRRQAATST